MSFCYAATMHFEAVQQPCLHGPSSYGFSRGLSDIVTRIDNAAGTHSSIYAKRQGNTSRARFASTGSS
jgi:hypothetical protein